MTVNLKRGRPTNPRRQTLTTLRAMGRILADQVRVWNQRQSGPDGKPLPHTARRESDVQAWLNLAADMHTISETAYLIARGAEAQADELKGAN